MTVCTQCAARRASRRPTCSRCAHRGAAVFVEESLRPGAQALVY
ncbi:hypothetical protein NKG05_17540 [Oerskovia sp. M15]